MEAPEIPPTENTTAPPPPIRTSYTDRLQGTLSLQPGSFRSIAADPSTLQSVFTALLGIALIGSLGTLVLTLTIVYPLLVLAGVTLSFVCSRFVAARLLASQIPSDELPSYPNWILAQYFVLAPWAIGVVPIVGSFVAIVYSMVLEVYSITDITGCSTGQAIVILLLSLVLPFVVGTALAVIFGAGILGMLGLGALPFLGQ